MIRNLKLLISYDGSDFKGWQFQPNVRTVQGDIETQILKLFNDQQINLIGSGRTDSGVHAKEQVASIKLKTDWKLDNIKNALNANLKDDVYIKKILNVDQNFHARFSAKERSYKYYVSNQYRPNSRFYVWFTKKKLNLKLLNQCSDLIKKNNDFTNFCKSKSEVKNKICNIFQSHWECKDEILIYSVKANRFLHHMVRFLVGTMIEVSRGRMLMNDFEQMLNNQKTAYEPLCAPAKGLFLYKIGY